MKHIDIKQWREWPTEKISSRVLYVLAGIAVLIFVLFWLIGYDRPYEEDPNFSEPLFTGMLLVFIELLFLLSVAIAAWSMVRALKIRGKAEAMDNNIPVKKIGYGVAIGTVALLLVSFALSSTTPMKINGATFNNVLWLKVADMFIVTSLTLMLVAVGAVVYGSTKYRRKP